MNPTQQLRRTSIDELRESLLSRHLDAVERYLSERGYASVTKAKYLRCLARFARWMQQQQLTAEGLDEDTIARFVNDPSAQGRGAGPVSCGRADLRAALHRLLDVLRAEAVIAAPPAGTTPVDEELRGFDEHLEQVRGLAVQTRAQYRHTVSCLLREHFAKGRVDLAAITPDGVRQFVARQSVHYRTRSGAAALISALRGYFRFRTTCGDRVHGLSNVLSHPANWQQATLPQALSRTDVARLVASLDGPGPSARRTAAMVRCALDLGLRRGEIATLALDDIDWRAGAITLQRTKGRRTDRLPLPATTGRAIADYLQYERPPTTSRAVFVRRTAPRGRSLGADGVAKAIRRAYARAGLPYTRAHLLRHTLASRLLASGSSLKEVADVLRHRSLTTTLIYAKLDSRQLVTVALPWPGEAP